MMQGVTVTVNRELKDVEAPWSVYAYGQESPGGSFAADLKNTGCAQMFFHGVTEGMRNAHIQGARIVKKKNAVGEYEIWLHCTTSDYSWRIETPGILNNEPSAGAFAKGIQFGIGLMRGRWETPIVPS
ncbi:MAG: hypothetical protein RL681_700 [Candidatus Parcubacteria bacterium]|jgi:hypothetical protein